MAERPRKKAPIAVSRKGRRPFRGTGTWPDATEALAALARAWMVTTVGTALLLAALGLSQIWDTKIYLRALRDTLSGEPTSVQPIEDAPAHTSADREIRLTP
jgi:hypothetical protein